MTTLTDWRYAPVERRDVVVIPTIRVTALLSLIFHVAMFWLLVPRLPNLSPNDSDPGKAATVLVTRLAPAPPPMIVTPPPPPPPASPRPSLRERPAVRPSPPTLPTLPDAATPTRQEEPPLPTKPPAVTAPPPPRTASEPDLASYIEARRRERGDPTTTASPGAESNTPPSETETERLNRSVAASIATSRQTTFGYDPKTGGGVFELRRIGYLDAEFYFTGWDKEIGRRARQLIEVRKGNNNDIREAIVRRIIEIIRDEVQGEFTWQSARLGRRLVMSARLRDNAELEAFLMQEFFSDPRQPR